MVKNLIFQDAVYGKIVIADPVAIDILKSTSMNRLNDIDMAGYSAGFYPGSRHSRLEHSIGVYYLLSSHGARSEECLHGLLHDISHTVFSHAIDYVQKESSGAKQDFQDQIFQSFIGKTEIPRILEGHGLDPDFIFNEENFPLQERPLPQLCADRLDYALRGFFHYKIMPLDKIRYLTSMLRDNGEEWYFETHEAAQTFASSFSKLDDEVFDSLKSAAMFLSVGTCIKYALDHSILNYDDLFTTDSYALDKIKAHLDHDHELNRLWSKMNGVANFEDNPDSFDSVVLCKSRIVDPKFLNENGSLTTLSHVSKEWKKTVRLGLIPKTYHLKFLD